jgi:hypothetical protein
MILDIPRFKCYIRNEFITDGKQTGFTEAYCFAVTCIESRPLLFTIHTEDGAVYSRLPLWAILLTDKPTRIPNESHDIWGAISSDAGIIEHRYLKDYTVHVQNYDESGRYLFTIDYFTGGHAQDPEQHKTSNIIALNSGTLIAVPNNYCKFIDRHFTNESECSIIYKRQSKYWRLP